MKHLRLVVLMAVVGLLGAACGGDGGGGNGGDGGSTAGTVTMVDNAFEPTDPTVASGDTLSLENQGQATHTFTLEDDSIDEQVAAGSTASVTVSLDPGSYGFACTLHPEMTGTLTVQ
ncbi:MAG: cupredoxin domain-containing protein [Actinomycetota bacterium]